MFPNCSKCLNKKDKNGKLLKNDSDFVESLLENNGVAVLQGSAFGMNGHFRISYETSMENLKKALKKINSLIFFIILGTYYFIKDSSLILSFRRKNGVF